MTISISIGTTGGTTGGGPATLDLEELLATRLLVQGNSGSGKSHLLRRLLEQSAAWVQQAVIDPEGEFVSLAQAFGHVVIDAADYSEAALPRIAERVRQHRVSVVLNLENLEVDLQMRHAAAFLNGLFEAEREHWYPLLVVVDEAQLFAPAAAGDVSDEARKAALGAMTNLMCRGRKRGLAGVVATQRLAKLAKNVAAEASNFLMGRTFLDIDMARAADLLGMERRQADNFRDLGRGQFMALGPALSRRPLTVLVGEVQTGSHGGSPKLLPLPAETPEDARGLILDAAEPESLPRRAPRPAPVPVATVLQQLAQARAVGSASPAAAEPEVPEIDPAERSARMETVLRQVLEEPEAAQRPVPMLYQDFLVRCRIQRLGAPMDPTTFRRKLAAARAGVTSASEAPPGWERAQAIADQLPEDFHGLFLLLARAAFERAPCPPDAQLAHALGSHSSGRARRVLNYMEQRGFIVIQSAPAGQRLIALPELELATAPGDPDAPFASSAAAA